MMGARDVQFIIPDRMIHGYGLSPSVVKLAAEYRPDLIVTVDNGIASFDGADAVNALGNPTTLEDGTVVPGHPCELLVTDHHLAAEKACPMLQSSLTRISQTAHSQQGVGGLWCDVLHHHGLAISPSRFRVLPGKRHAGAQYRKTTRPGGPRHSG